MSFGHVSENSLGKNLRRILKERHISVAELSKRTGVPLKTIYHWFTGQQPRKIEYLFSIGDELGLSIDDLYGRSQKKPDNEHLLKGLQDDVNAGVFEVILRPISRLEKKDST